MKNLVEYTDEEITKIYEFYMSDKNITITDAAATIGVSKSPLRRRFAEMGLKSKPRNYARVYPTKEDHPRWSGGPMKSGKYYYIRLLPDNPYFSMTKGTDKILYHRYVMAQYLGRPLTESETVHHIDGDRANNNITNLQLRIGNHGHGQVYACDECGSRRISPVELD